MYDLYIMRRTQIYLTDAHGRLLQDRRRASGRTISQLIRDAIDATYASGRRLSQDERLRIARRAAGAWADRDETGTEYVERIRGSRRLARLRGRT